MGASGRTLRSAEVSEGAPTSCVQMACGMCYTRAGDADLLGRGHWLGCFSIEYERGVVGVEGELLISTGSYYEGVQSYFSAAGVPRACVS
jgi:hypothetical protein